MRGAPTRFARRGEHNLAYQVIGDGGRAVVFEWTTFISIDLIEEHQPAADFLARLAQLGQLVVYDRHGVGLSDPVTSADGDALTTRAQALDLLAVLDHAGIQDVDVVSEMFRTPVAVELAALAPERVRHLVLIDPIVRVQPAPDFPFGSSVEESERLVEHVLAGTADATRGVQGPTDGPERDWFDRAGRHGASPRTAEAIYRSYSEYDVRSLLGAVTVPTLLIGRAERLPIGRSQLEWIATQLPDASVEQLAMTNASWYELADELLGPIEHFLTGVSGLAPSSRVLSTVMFTDVVGSTHTLAEVGDGRWRELLTRHDEIVAEATRRAGGRIVVTTGDGVLASYPGPSAAIACARAIRDAVNELGLELRAAIHAGEVEQRGADIAGLAVHVASRLLGAAAPGAILVSGVAAALLAGTDAGLMPGPTLTLRDVPGEWTTACA
jgi:class 3 adenylate cyclase